MYRGTVVAGALVIVAACSSFDEADDVAPAVDAGPENDAGPTADAGTDAIVGMCRPEEIGSTQHCGRCGRDCGGGACVAGECEPYRVQLTAFPWYLAVDATDVYWTSPASVGGTGEVAHAPKLGKGSVLMTWSSPGVFDVVVVDGTVFVTELGPNAGTAGVHRMKPDGTGRERVTDPSIELAVSGSRVYAVTTSSTGSNPTFEIGTTGAPRPVIDLPNANRSPEGVATDGVDLFFADHQMNGHIEKVSLSSPAGPASVASVVSPRRIAIDDTYVYWISDSDHAVRRAPKVGGPQQDLATLDARYGRVLADGPYLYVTAEIDGKVVRMNKDGSNVRTIKANLLSPIGLTQDETAIYFAEHAQEGGIWRMVK